MQLPTFQSSSSSDEARIITDSCCREFYDHLREIINDKLRRIGESTIFVENTKIFFQRNVFDDQLWLKRRFIKLPENWSKYLKSTTVFLGNILRYQLNITILSFNFESEDQRRSPKNAEKAHGIALCNQNTFKSGGCLRRF